MNIHLIVAHDEKNGIGKNAELAWRLTADLKHFSTVTKKTNDPNKKNTVIMGRKTWESLPKTFRPLPDRINCILTTNPDFAVKQLNSFVFHSLDACLSALKKQTNIESIFIIGGASLYKEALEKNIISKAYITKLKGDFGCDVFFQKLPDTFKLVECSEKKQEGDLSFQFFVYENLQAIV